ncbi:DNA topoisomerase 1 [Gemmata obscuriglobus]|uniref:AAA+ ATPase domain-containing protein n=1 Tax=Gemmata obscuriglobus TaxID=114 RepID=A0A2Z3HET3_9BACT|nr:AAA domain-containing protein [Gemmata obscuriglobus]AWM39810.1 hypothetical protein C1280_24250 [Gemmata obscuriglobus]QEG27071.1 DNA topoisomerase 1 [Gemmata obscuriglobus]VTS03506.1 dna topoisomerase i : Uncharacterized protein OS=Neosynechococcus sphagnicola sy1 GN=DO97_01325 PE=4 SV=1: AAA_11: AAA_12: zf-C4_Topoisom [Gemmata obscuriglobus UQM 2246]
MDRKQLAAEVTRILRSARAPMLSKDILDRVRAKPGGGVVTKSEVAAVLSGDLTGQGSATRDEEFRWRYTGLDAIWDTPAPASPGLTPNSVLPVPRPPIARPVRTCPPVLSPDDLASVEAAVREEIAAAKEDVRSSWLDIDGIEHLADAPGGFIYRLVLSTPVHLTPDQAVTFQTRNPRETISAVVVKSDDEGLVVVCQNPLPADAKLLQMTFDPTFILRALEGFVSELAPTGGQIARLVLTKTAPAPSPVQPRPHPKLNEEQCLAVEEMAATPLHLLWGPPGTGKTTTLGAAVARWLRQGQRVLVVSTSNAAVDVALKAVLSRLQPEEKDRVLRLGSSLDPVVREVTLGGKLAAQNPKAARLVAKAQNRLADIQEQLRSRPLDPDRLHALHNEAREYETRISEFQKQADEAGPALADSVLVTGCTLAKMVLDKTLRAQTFDVVVVDEASMVSLLYAVAASMLAGAHLVYAGDPQQLPPIVQADGRNAARWFGQNVYDWFGIAADGSAPTRLSLLRTQYRMTTEIGGVVSRLSYNDLLRHGRGATGPTVEFIDVGGEWETRPYSISEKSYYHLAAVPIIHALIERIPEDELLLLSPFRPQRSLLSALAFDLRERGGRKATASTIHRAQGSEAKAVVVDLTTHSPDKLAAFFRDEHCDKLFNVAISRARDRLVVIGSKAMLRELAKAMPFWKRVVSEFGTGITLFNAADVIEKLTWADSPGALPATEAKHLPALYSHDPALGAAKPGVEALKRLTATRKLFVTHDVEPKIGQNDIIVRTGSNCPPVFAGGGYVCVPLGGRWVAVNSPNVTRVLWRIGFSHLADDEVDPNQARRFYCPECPNGDLVLRQSRGEGWFLVCVNPQVRECSHRKRLSLEDARLKVRLQGMRCPAGHPLTARSSGHGFFLGCENYPRCDFAQGLSILEGV